MKQIIIFTVIAAIGIAACGSTKETVVEPVISDVIKGKVERYTFNSEKTDSVNCIIEYNYFASSKLAYRDSVNLKIKKYISQITQFEGQKQTNSIITDAFFKAQLDTFCNVNEENYDAEMNQLWELESSIQIDDSHEKFVQLHLSAWSYTGGAHGNGSTTTYILDKITAKTLLLEDIFTDVKAVTDIGEIYFRKLFELAPDTDLNDAGFWFENNLFHLNNNFSIVGDKIEFLYNTYEIAPYSGGSTTIEIPLAEIRAYLKVKI